MTEKKLYVLPNAIQESTIKYVRDLLTRCEAGEVVAVTAMTERRDGTMTIEGGETMSVFQTAGMLLHAAIVRLTSNEEE